MPKTVIIADDYELFRDAVQELILHRLGFTVVGSVGDAHAAFVACQACKPGTLILDLDMPGRDALATLADIRWASPNTRVVILTERCHDAIIESALKHNVAAYLLKSESTEELRAAFKRVLDGQCVFSAAVQSRFTTDQRRKPRHSVESTRLSRLSPRESEVLRYIGRGMDNGEMARVMILSKRTVERHVSRLMKSLDIHDRSELQRFASDEMLSA